MCVQRHIQCSLKSPSSFYRHFEICLHSQTVLEIVNFHVHDSGQPSNSGRATNHVLLESLLTKDSKSITLVLIVHNLQKRKKMRSKNFEVTRYFKFATLAVIVRQQSHQRMYQILMPRITNSYQGEATRGENNYIINFMFGVL